MDDSFPGPAATHHPGASAKCGASGPRADLPSQISPTGDSGAHSYSRRAVLDTLLESLLC